MEKLKPCPCGCKDIELRKYPLWHGTNGYVGSYEFTIKCSNPNCYWTFNAPKNDTVYRSEEEAKENVINAWNKRG
jgi:hypothetical protein